MARLARVVAVQVPHHVTQRGNARRFILESDSDKLVYIDLLRQYCSLYDLSVLGYCLMSNHVHLVVTPRKNDSLALALKNTHGRYAAYWNATHSSSGHVWQGRYYSCPLDLPHMWSALRYTELNPIRAGIVSNPETYRWSSAAAHCGRAQADLPRKWICGGSNGIARHGKNIYAIQTRELISKRFGSVRIQGAPWERRSSLPLWRTVPVACLRRRKLVVRRGWLRIVINHYSTSIRKRPVCPRISCPEFPSPIYPWKWICGGSNGIARHGKNIYAIQTRELISKRFGSVRIVINHYSTSIRKRPVCPRISVPEFPVPEFPSVPEFL